MFQRLPVALAQLKAGNTAEILFVSSIRNHWEAYKNIMNSIKL